MANHVFVAGQKTVVLYFKPFLFQLHHERRAQVNEIGIANIGKQGIGKALWVLLKQGFKIGFPKKINELRKTLLRLFAVVPKLKMIAMEKLYVLHGFKVRQSANENQQ